MTRGKWLAVALMVANIASARATTTTEFYTGNSFTSFSGGQEAPPEKEVYGYIVLNDPLSQYLTLQSQTEIEVDSSAGNVVAHFGAAQGLSAAPADSFFTMTAFLNSAGTAIDWSQGWSITAGYSIVGGFADVFSTAPDGGIGGSDEYDASTGASASNESDPGSWLDPVGPRHIVNGVLVTPEPSTWAMMVLGFLGLGIVAARRARSVKLG